MNFVHTIRRAARDTPERTALTDPERAATFVGLDAGTDAVANALPRTSTREVDKVTLAERFD